MRKTILTLASVALFGCNSLPYTGQGVLINPGQPSTDDSLECFVDGTDATFDYSWYRDGELYSEDSNARRSYISDLETQAGEEWYCEVYVPPMPGSSDFYVGQDSVKIENLI
jgi:hypothetical protein